MRDEYDIIGSLHCTGVIQWLTNSRLGTRYERSLPSKSEVQYKPLRLSVACTPAHGSQRL